MASYDYTFTSGDTVTPTKLNNARNVKDIVNADIKSDAAIAGTKISPNFGSQNVVTTGSVGAQAGVSTTSDTSTFTPSGLSAIPNYGMGAPGSNVVSVAGFSGIAAYTNQTERMRIDASGNVGIGTSSVESGYKLHVVGNAFASAPSGTICKSTVDVTDQRTIIGAYFESGVGQYSYISSTNNAETGNSPLLFQTGTTERMRIDASGNVGIGTSSPLAALHVVRSSAGGIRVSGEQNDYTGIQIINASGCEAQFHANGNAGVDLRAVTNHPLSILTNNAERMRITSDGNVGIGKSNPATILDVSGTVTATAFAGPLTGTASAIADGSVSTAAKIADGVVTPAKLSGAQTGSAPIFGVRAWGEFAGQGSDGACVVAASGNVTSVSRISSSVYEIVMTTALPDANYAILCTSSASVSRIVDSFTKTTTTFRIEFLTTAAGLTNPSKISFMVIR